MAVLKPFQTAIVKDLISNYRFDQPFNTYFTTQSRMHKNWGSKDRKTYRQACYAYFRLGAAIRRGSMEENLALALKEPGDILSETGPEGIFPYRGEVSARLDFNAWAESLLYMRPVYLAVKTGLKDRVADWLNSHSIEALWVKDNCVMVKAESKCNALVDNGWAWIMDISSQNAAEIVRVDDKDEVWDACSGAGGKALYLANTYPGIQLTCSDKRFSVLENLKSRFHALGFGLPKIELADLTEPFQIPQKYNKILLDVPCSGSGTWGRTPEQINLTTTEKIAAFSALQKTIARNVVKNLAQDGRLYYVTCSVFHAENEDNVKHFCENYGLRLLNDVYLYTSFKDSDVLYIAELAFH